MSGSWLLLIIILFSSLPVIAIFIWFRIAKYKFSLTWFFLALLAGAAAFFPALFLQKILLFPEFTQGRAALIFEFFIRIAFTEELSRLLILFLFIWICNLILKLNKKTDSSANNDLLLYKGTAAGLIAGLGFFILESIRFTAASMDINIALLRIFTAALHGACGSRIGAAAVLFPNKPIQAVYKIIAATAMHGIYNFMVTIPGLPSVIACLIALSALAVSMININSDWKEISLDKNGVNQ